MIIVNEGKVTISGEFNQVMAEFTVLVDSLQAIVDEHIEEKFDICEAALDRINNFKEGEHN